MLIEDLNRQEREMQRIDKIRKWSMTRTQREQANGIYGDRTIRYIFSRRGARVS